MVGNLKNASPQTLDVNNAKELDDGVAAHDLIISLIPYTYHVAVIKAAIKHKRNVVTTSYVSDEMKALEPQYASIVQKYLLVELRKLVLSS